MKILLKRPKFRAALVPEMRRLRAEGKFAFIKFDKLIVKEWAKLRKINTLFVLFSTSVESRSSKWMFVRSGPEIS